MLWELCPEYINNNTLKHLNHALDFWNAEVVLGLEILWIQNRQEVEIRHAKNQEYSQEILVIHFRDLF
jgi:uncharacterized Fe-S cluster-containing MiaB family protein